MDETKRSCGLLDRVSAIGHGDGRRDQSDQNIGDEKRQERGSHRGGATES